MIRPLQFYPPISIDDRADARCERGGSNTGYWDDALAPLPYSTSRRTPASAMHSLAARRSQAPHLDGCARATGGSVAAHPAGTREPPRQGPVPLAAAHQLALPVCARGAVCGGGGRAGSRCGGHLSIRANTRHVRRLRWAPPWCSLRVPGSARGTGRAVRAPGRAPGRHPAL